MNQNLEDQLLLELLALGFQLCSNPVEDSLELNGNITEISVQSLHE